MGVPPLDPVSTGLDPELCRRKSSWQLLALPSASACSGRCLGGEQGDPGGLSSCHVLPGSSRCPASL